MTYCYPYRKGTGWRSQAFRSNPSQGANGPGGHTGFDQAMDPNTPLYAPADGIVRNSSWVSENYLENPWWLTQMGGDILVLDCFGPDGTTDAGPAFILAHLSDSIADVGQRVRKGELIALSGNSGTASTGPHCHVEALPPNWDFNNGVYGRVDPETYFDEWPDGYIGSQGLAAMGGTITPLTQEDDMATVPQEEWEWAKQVLTALSDNAATKKDLAGVPQAVVTAQVPYKDPVTGSDTGQTTSLATMAGFADFQATATRALVLQGPAGVAAQINAAGLAESVRDELVKLIGGK